MPRPAVLGAGWSWQALAGLVPRRLPPAAARMRTTSRSRAAPAAAVMVAAPRSGSGRGTGDTSGVAGAGRLGVVDRPPAPALRDEGDGQRGDGAGCPGGAGGDLADLDGDDDHAGGEHADLLAGDGAGAGLACPGAAGGGGGLGELAGQLGGGQRAEPGEPLARWLPPAPGGVR